MTKPGDNNQEGNTGNESGSKPGNTNENNSSNDGANSGATHEESTGTGRPNLDANTKLSGSNTPTNNVVSNPDKALITSDNSNHIVWLSLITLAGFVIVKANKTKRKQ